MNVTSSRFVAVLATAVFAAAGLSFLPGASGPFIFDDTPNLLQNQYVQISELNLDSLRQAAYSLKSGPLQRPVSMASFALNYYFAGGFGNPLPFKLTNIVIHAINSLLVFWLAHLFLARAARLREPDRSAGAAPARHHLLLAAGIALIWAVHPIQLTSVLYVVQRMNSLAAMFTLLALICYVHGRTGLIAGRKIGAAAAMLGTVGLGTLGMFAKENTALLPLFIAAIELTLFRGEAPWNRWSNLATSTKAMIGVVALVIAGVALARVVGYALPAYEMRSFTPIERLLTEARVLFFYLSLMVVPRLNEFGVYHDDIPISVSLTEPLITLPAVAGIALLAGIAIAIRRRHPLLSLGILWFFAGHALESTIIALEIAHEHRNYLPSFGVWLMLAHAVDRGRHHVRFGRRADWLPPVLAAAFATISVIRSHQWSDIQNLAFYEAQHHPNSASALNFHGVVLGQHQRYADAIAAFRRASEIDGDDAIYLINMHVAAVAAGAELDPVDHAELVRRIAQRPYTGSTSVSLITISTCILDSCRQLQPVVIRWMQQLTRNPPPNSDQAFFHYLLGTALSGQGRTEEALTVLRKAIAIDNRYLHPRVEIVRIFLNAGKRVAAEQALADLRAANVNHSHPRDREIAELTAQLAELERSGRKTIK
jgi:protein O-mannosyl-transferase